MAMLAEPKRRQKWTLNPRGKQWSEDSNKFGQKMLEKMGWTSGKGLGANEQGMTEHVRVKFKDDAGGIGYSRDEQDKYWTEHQENFNDLLQKLQTGDESSEISPPEIKKSTDLSGMSLEIKSKQSRARVHYQKFTRGKDVNKYSTKDLANIFGKKDLQEFPKAPEPISPPPNESPAPVGSTDTTGGVLTIKGGSMSDYFKSKFPNFLPTPKKSQRDDEKSSESESERYVGFGFSSPSISSIFSTDKSKSNNEIIDNKTPLKRKSEFYVETPNSLKINKNCQKSKKLETSVDVENHKLDFNSPEVQSSGINSKKNKNEKENSGEKLNLESENNFLEVEKKCKKKRSREKLGLESDISDILPIDSSKKSKKKKKKEVEPVECIPQVLSPSPPPENSPELPKKPPKKPPRSFLVTPELEMTSPDLSTPDIPKKSKKSKKKNFEIEENSWETLKNPQLFGFENPALNLESPEPEEMILETPKSLKKNKNDTFEGFINPALNLELKTDENSVLSSHFEVSRDPGVSRKDTETPKKFKKSRKKEIENVEGHDNLCLNLNSITDENSRVFSKFEVSRDPGVSEVVLETPKSPKKSKKKKIENFEGHVNLCLNLNSGIDENQVVSNKFEVSRDPGVSYEVSNEVLETPKNLRKNKKKKTDDFEGHVNLCLNLNSKIDKNPVVFSKFEVSRDSGVSNIAIDLSDECSCKKRVTFNDEVEYNTDSSKKKKLKRKLDKFEVNNEKLKKKKSKKEGSGLPVVTGFINPALDVEVISEEIIDNEENEKKFQENKKNERRMKKRRISNLETIAEIPEEEKDDSRGKMGIEGVGGEEDNYETPVKKKRKNKNREIEENFKENFDGEISKKSHDGGKRVGEVEGVGDDNSGVKSEVLQLNNSVIQADDASDGRTDRSKRKLKKSQFNKSPILHFEGSNINDIRGYGINM